VGHAVGATGRRDFRLPSFKFSLVEKAKGAFIIKPFDVQDVLVPTLPQDVANLVGQRFSGLNGTLRFSLFTISTYFIGKDEVFGVNNGDMWRRLVK